MKLGVVVVHRNRPDLVERLMDQLPIVLEMARRNWEFEDTVLVVDCGSTHRVEYPHYWYPDPDFTGGKTRGFIEGMKLLPPQDYYLLLHPDVCFSSDLSALKQMLRVAMRNRGIGLVSPHTTNPFFGMDSTGPDPTWHKTAASDFLAWLIRGEAYRDVGPIDGRFSLGWGTNADYPYRLWKRGWMVAYCDATRVHHLGGTTYGIEGTATKSRRQYLLDARLEAWTGMCLKYGDDWGELMSEALPRDVDVNGFMLLWDLWSEEAFIPADV